MTTNNTQNQNQVISSKAVPAAVVRALRAANDQEKIFGVFNDRAGFGATLGHVYATDAAHIHENGEDTVVFAQGKTPARIIGQFNEVCLQQWENDDRPSLPMLATKILASKGIDATAIDTDAALGDEEKAIARAILVTAARAEMVKGQVPGADVTPNPYHNTVHTAHVTTMAALLGERNEALASEGQSISLPLKDRLLLVLAALGHDVDHPGGGNPDNDIYAFEKRSFAIVKDIMEAEGVPAADIDKVETMLLTTSPKGPHAFLKEAAKSFRDGVAPQTDERYPELDVLTGDPSLTQMAAILSDSDLFASSGAGLAASRRTSAWLTAELKAVGLNMDLTTDGARLFFLDNIVGKDGYASNAARDMFSNSLESLRTYTQSRLAAAAPKPAM